MGGGTQYIEALIRWPTLSTSGQTYSSRFGWTDTNATSDASNAVYWMYEPTVTFTCTGTSANSSTAITSLGSCTGVLDTSSIQTSMTITDSKSCFQAGTTVSVAPVGAGSTLTLSQSTNGSGCGSSDTFTFTIGNYLSAKVIHATTVSRQVTNQAVVANTWYKPEITINAGNTAASFYINGSLIKTITTTMPTVAMGPEFEILEISGTTNSSFIDADYYKHCFVPTTAR
jgi:hypothetical protein